ncbi:MAG: molecular chaperone TorD family protein [Nitrospirota bacterium]
MENIKEKKREITEIDHLFVDEKDARFWKTEGVRHNNLFWVRAMISRKREPAPVEEEDVVLPINTSEKVRNYKTKSLLYKFLADGYNEPTEEFTRGIVNGTHSDNLGGLFKVFTGNKRMDDGRAAILNMNGQKFAETFDSLREEYCRNIYDTYLPFISPYESVYRGERQVMGLRTSDVNERYKKAGLGVEGGEMPDYISHECEFVSILSERIAGLLEEGNIKDAEEYEAMCVEFLRDHLLQWGAKFCEDLLALAKSDFYKGMALLGRGVFNKEYNRLKILGVL